MLYTAAIMICLIDQPHTYENCQVINAHFKYQNEEMCAKAIAGQITYQQLNLLANGYELIDVKCIEWIPKKVKI